MKKRYITVSFCFLIILLSLSGCKKSQSAGDIVELGNYKGLKATKMSTNVSDEDVMSKIRSDILSDSPYEEIKDRDNVKEGDIVNITFVGKIEGEAFEGGSSDGYDLKIGSGTFIDGFEDSLIGMKKSETKDIDLTFPSDYGEPSLAGKPVTFTVTVNKIQKDADITDGLVKTYTNGEYTSIVDYTESVKAELEKEYEEYSDSALYTDLLNQVLNNSRITGDIPDDLIDRKKQTIRNSALSMAESYGMTVEDFVTNVLGKSSEEFESDIEDYALEAAKKSLVLSALAENESLEVTDEELEEGIDTYVETYGYSSKDEFIETVDMEEFKEYILESKVEKFLADNADITIQE
ncbi:MAG: trigger factor [Lachnospiraceae bacterium]|nr:trigger factor [Lachnospiraceae bacterium]